MGKLKKVNECHVGSCVMIDMILVGIRSGKILRRKRAVPETDTGGVVEYTKAIERIILKELGQLTQ